jgi:hypothetical protein
MLSQNAITPLAAFLGVLAAFTGSAHAVDISGTITSTLTITEDSQLVDDVTCTVTGAPCIEIGAPHMTLELNGFTMTGLADPQVGCGGAVAWDALASAILVSTQTDVAIHGPGLIQRFLGHGINIRRVSTGVRVTGVTLSTNCLSGVFVSGCQTSPCVSGASSNNEISNNILVRNGNTTAPCGGI